MTWGNPVSWPPPPLGLLAWEESTTLGVDVVWLGNHWSSNFTAPKIVWYFQKVIAADLASPADILGIRPGLKLFHYVPWHPVYQPLMIIVSGAMWHRIFSVLCSHMVFGIYNQILQCAYSERLEEMEQNAWNLSARSLGLLSHFLWRNEGHCTVNWQKWPLPAYLCIYLSTSILSVRERLLTDSCYRTLVTNLFWRNKAAYVHCTYIMLKNWPQWQELSHLSSYKRVSHI